MTVPAFDLAAHGRAMRARGFWLDRNYFAEGARRLEAVLEAAPETTELRVSVLLAAAALEQRCGS
jgi:hypothetical protein